MITQESFLRHVRRVEPLGVVVNKVNIQAFARRQTVGFGKRPQRLLDIVAEPSVDLAWRKMRAVEQHLEFYRERRDAVFRRQLAGEIGAVDPLRREFSGKCRMKQAGEYQCEKPAGHAVRFLSA